MGGPQCFDGKCKKDNINLLHFLTSGMHSRGIEYWLDFGGLLGVVREGDMIEGDDDMDICATTAELEKVVAYFDDINKDPQGLYQVSKNTMSRVCGDYEGKTLMLYHVRPRSGDSAALLDLFFFEDDGGGDLRSMWTHEDDTFVDTIFPVQKFYVEKWGFSVSIPNKPTNRLIEKYGKDFMIPVSYKTTAMGRFIRSKNVFGRCMGNKYRGTDRNTALKFLFLCSLVVFIIIKVLRKNNDVLSR